MVSAIAAALLAAAVPTDNLSSVATDERLSVGTVTARSAAAIADTISQSSFSVSSV